MLPIIFKSSYITIYSFPLFLGIAIGIAYNTAKSLLEKDCKISKGLNLYFIGAVLSSWIGAKIFFLFFSSLDSANNLKDSSFWFGGGLVFYGGLLFLIIFSSFYYKYFDKIREILPALILGHAIGRIGCFMAGCCYGKYIPQLNINHPVQLYESFFLFILFFIFIKIRKKYPPLILLSFYLLTYSSVRFLLEFIRADSIRGIHNFQLSTSQYISLIIITLIPIILLFKRRFLK